MAPISTTRIVIFTQQIGVSVINGEEQLCAALKSTMISSEHAEKITAEELTDLWLDAGRVIGNLLVNQSQIDQMLGGGVYGQESTNQLLNADSALEKAIYEVHMGIKTFNDFPRLTMAGRPLPPTSTPKP